MKPTIKMRIEAGKALYAEINKLEKKKLTGKHLDEYMQTVRRFVAVIHEKEIKDCEFIKSRDIANKEIVSAYRRLGRMQIGRTY